MNSYLNNYATQNQRALYPNYIQGPTTNPIQAPINNFNQVIPQYISPQTVNMNPIPAGYNQVNILSHKINPAYQQQNIRALPPNPNINITQSTFYSKYT